MRRAACSLALITVLLAGCSTSDVPRKNSIIPQSKLHVFPNYAIAFSDLVQVGLLVGAVYMVTDPSEPAWRITETRLPDQRVLYKLEKQYLSIGGDGEARYVITQRLDALAREQGMSGYQLERYEEAIDSRILLPRRTAYAEARLVAAK